MRTTNSRTCRIPGCTRPKATYHGRITQAMCWCHRKQVTVANRRKRKRILSPWRWRPERYFSAAALHDQAVLVAKSARTAHQRRVLMLRYREDRVAPWAEVARDLRDRPVKSTLTPYLCVRKYVARIVEFARVQRINAGGGEWKPNAAVARTLRHPRRRGA